MLNRNRIIGFISISFVLVFMGKISKMGLYSSYFKTISEIQFRNCHDLEPDGVWLEQDFSLDDEPSLLMPDFNPDQGLVIVSSFSLSLNPEQVQSFINSRDAYRNRFNFLVSAPVRAPSS